MDNKKLLGKRIKELRKYRNFTQEKLAELIDIEPCSLSAIEIGRHFPSLPTLEKISKTLNVELKTLFEYSSSKSKDEKLNEIINALSHLPDNKLDFIYRFVDYYAK